MSLVIGIDLGTTTTEAAVYRNGKPEMLMNFDGEAVTPSAVGIDREGNWVVGSRARAQYLLEPGNTAIEVKRKTGTGETVKIGKTQYEPVELQARLLSFVRSYASEYLGENVERAVISVPAYFDNRQRLETVMAGHQAGFFVERIINEPTAAAMCYGLEHMEEESHVLVYDLGGGTFDVTLLEMFEGVLEVKASGGDNQLGGKDFDDRLMDCLLNRFQQKHGKNLRTDPYAMARVKEEAEKCKIALSEADQFRVLLPAVYTDLTGPIELDEIITRTDFEEMTRDLLDRTHHPMDVVLQDSGLKPEQLDHIILVGGSTRMPMVAEDIEEYMKIKPENSVHPDYAVALGAAIQSGIISGEIEPEDGLVMTDVCPYSLGIRTADDGVGDAMSIIIPRNTTIPVSRTERYCTHADCQCSAQIAVYQGESGLAIYNHYLGEFMISGIPPAPAGKEKMDVQFSYDLNGILQVKASLLSSSNNSRELTIDTGKQHGEEDVSLWKSGEMATSCRSVIRNAEKLIFSGVLPMGEEERLQDKIYQLKYAILKNQKDDVDALKSAVHWLTKTLKEKTIDDEK